MEKEEVGSLRDAMEEMDLHKNPQEGSQDNVDEEGRIYEAALDEAAELVWQHQNGKPPPRPDGPYRYRPHLRKNSYAHARTASVNSLREEAKSGSGTSSASGSSTASESPRRTSEDSKSSRAGDQSNRVTKSYGSVKNRPGPFSGHRRRSSMRRNISGEVERPFSGDQIWEEPETPKSSFSAGRASPQKLSSRPQNPFSRYRSRPTEEEDTAKPKPLNRIEIQRNPPSQSRNPLYTKNSPTETPRVDDSVPKKNGMELRSQDIREATSMRLKDRSSKLPEPTAVSDSPGRPIVSFDTNWKAPDEATDVNPDQQSPAPSSKRFQSSAKPMDLPSIVVAEDDTPGSRASTGTSVPSISVAGPDDKPNSSVPQINVPSIAVDEAPGSSSVPSIVTPDDKPAARGARPLPTPGSKGTRRIQQPRGHWSPAPGASARATTICHECGYPIEGRFIALAGCSERFHPKCFACFTCGTSLEAMEISPEPEQVRAQRLERIKRRTAGEILEEEPGMTAVEDGDDRLRFFCHLDWHELYAPRCKHCKTPILGEHIVALGEHWHYGHFFCAECGDPFDHGMTHIEKDGYAWCINCQTKRTERRAPKCKKCRIAVIGQYIQALGGEWHEHCFRCAECQGGFDDGQVFPKEIGGGTVVLCTACRSRELKM